VKRTVGQQIRKIRQAKDLTQDNLAFELGITKSAYSKIEREESNISIKRLEQIAKVLEVDIVDFFKEEPDENAVEDTKAQYSIATKEDIEEIARMVQEMSRELGNLKDFLNNQNNEE
jgi:transcriptional regulator with XRE-family HTH domain